MESNTPKNKTCDTYNTKYDINHNPPILPRSAVIQDMSGFGRVSLTEAIPIMSAMGIEVCPLPTAILSTHTYDFTDYTLLDMTDEMPKIINHWDKINLKFNAVYSGYLGSKKQIDIISDFMKAQKKLGALIIVDPVMGDNALSDVKTLYSKRMEDLIDGMANMCSFADVITPNLTEACLLLNRPYSAAPMSDEDIKNLLKALASLGPKAITVTSIMDSDNSMCAAVYMDEKFFKVDCSYVNRPFHGTGDVFTSVLTGAVLNGYDVVHAANIAADFVSQAIELTVKYPDIPIRHGVLFEPILKEGYFSENNLKNIKNRITELK